MAGGNEAQIVVGGADLLDGASTDRGYIKSGVTLKKEQDFYFVEEVEGIPTPPKGFRTRLQYVVNATLIEPTLTYLKWAYDVVATVVTGPPATLEFGKKNELGGTERIITLKSYEAGSTDVRTVTMDRCLITEVGELKFTQFEEAKVQITARTVYNDTADRNLIFSDA
jgi:hypothetical protein